MINIFQIWLMFAGYKELAMWGLIQSELELYFK